jgi:hypothetical protein
MTAIQQVGDLEIDTDMHFQRRSWVVQRCGWVVFTLIILGALMGLFGPGPISNTTIGDARLRVEYERFGRLQDSMALVIYVGPGVAQNGAIRLSVDRQYLHGIEVRHVIPDPQLVESDGDQLIYIFHAVNPDQPISITFHVDPEKIGLLTGWIGLDGGPTLEFSQFIYP